MSLAAATTFAVGTAVTLTTVGLVSAALILIRQGLPAAPWRLASLARSPAP